MNKLVWFMGIIKCMGTVVVQGAESTNQVLYTALIENETRFIPRWQQELIPTSSRIIYDRFGPPSQFNWISSYDHQGYAIHEFTASYGRSAMSKIVESAARESAANTLPLDEYEHDGRYLWSVMAHFVRGSIGNTAEEEVSVVSTTSSYETLKHIADTEQVNRKKAWDYYYGFRPLNSKPYFYYNANVGHFAGRQLLHMSTRLYWHIFDNVSLIKVESQAIVTLGKQTQFVIGGELYPTDITSEEHQTSASARIETTTLRGILSIGVTTSRAGNSCTANWSWRF